jgi:hypothetical protein
MQHILHILQVLRGPIRLVYAKQPQLCVPTQKRRRPVYSSLRCCQVAIRKGGFLLFQFPKALKYLDENLAK